MQAPAASVKQPQPPGRLTAAPPLIHSMRPIVSECSLAKATVLEMGPRTSMQPGVKCLCKTVPRAKTSWGCAEQWAGPKQHSPHDWFSWQCPPPLRAFSWHSTTHVGMHNPGWPVVHRQPGVIRWRVDETHNHQQCRNAEARTFHTAMTLHSRHTTGRAMCCGSPSRWVGRLLYCTSCGAVQQHGTRDVYTQSITQ